MNDHALTRIAMALNELAAGILELSSGSAGASPSSPAPAPAAAFNAAQPKSQTENTVCPIHNVEFRTTKRDGTPAKRAFCSGKMPDGSYCQEKGAWLG